MTLQSQDFQPLDVLEAVKLNKDLPSALKYLSHSCPICEEQVTFSKVRPPGSSGTRPVPVLYGPVPSSVCAEQVGLLMERILDICIY